MANSRGLDQGPERPRGDQALDGTGENPADLSRAVEADMRWLVWLAVAALTGLAGGCVDDKSSPFTFKEFPGYTPAGAKVPADPHHTTAGYDP